MTVVTNPRMVRLKKAVRGHRNTCWRYLVRQRFWWAAPHTIAAAPPRRRCRATSCKLLERVICHSMEPACAPIAQFLRGRSGAKPQKDCCEEDNWKAHSVSDYSSLSHRTYSCLCVLFFEFLSFFVRVLFAYLCDVVSVCSLS